MRDHAPSRTTLPTICLEIPATRATCALLMPRRLLLAAAWTAGAALTAGWVVRTAWAVTRNPDAMPLPPRQERGVLLCPLLPRQPQAQSRRPHPRRGSHSRQLSTRRDRHLRTQHDKGPRFFQLEPRIPDPVHRAPHLHRIILDGHAPHRSHDHASIRRRQSVQPDLLVFVREQADGAHYATILA